MERDQVAEALTLGFPEACSSESGKTSAEYELQRERQCWLFKTKPRRNHWSLRNQIAFVCVHAYA